MEQYKVIIAGTRDFADYQLLARKCDKILAKKTKDTLITIISGTAKGADRLGERYAKDRGYRVERFPANWDRDGNKAGPLRNIEMAKHADALIAFWDGRSRGTRHMIDTALNGELAVRVVNYNQIREKEKLANLLHQTSQYAIEHITGKGMHTGIAWLRDSFNEYFSAISSPTARTLDDAAIGHRQILAQKVAIDCIHALTHEQQQQLDQVLDEIAKDHTQGKQLK